MLSDLTLKLDRQYGDGDLGLAREVGRAASVWNNYHSAGPYVFEGGGRRRPGVSPHRFVASRSD